jgi:hypothetical protein
MIRAIAERDGQPVVVLFGLEPENLRRMAGNEPVRVNLSGMDPRLPDIDVVVFSTEGTSAEDMRYLFETGL